MAALFHHAHLASATRHLLDRDLLARHRTLCRPGGQRHEPKGQKVGVNALFVALILVVGGSLAGEWLGIEQKLGNLWFWFGSQGYEYVDLGRFWQILLLIGLTFWLWLMWRALKPALAARIESRSLLTLFLIASIAIPLFTSRV
jgi:nitric oxide reductase subunit B